MGLPIWRDPDEKKSTASSALATDPTACTRSSIRRRPSVRRTLRPRIPRDNPPPQFVDLSAVVALSPPLRPLANFPAVRVPEGAGSDDEQTRRESEARIERALVSVGRGLTSATRPNSPPYSTRRYDPALGAHEQRRRRELLSEPRHVTRPSFRLAPNAASDRADPPADTPRASGPIGQRRHTPHSSRPRGGTARHANSPRSPLSSRLSDGPQAPDTANVRTAESRRLHPLSHSWRPESPVDGLGDRDRSPIAFDGWEIIRTTITPDDTLPSADSSFTTAAASQSFNASTDTGVSATSSSSESRNTSSNDSQSDSNSSIDPDDLACSEEGSFDSDVFAIRMLALEEYTVEGRRRIDTQVATHLRNGPRYSLDNEPMAVDIGFRLIEIALAESASDRLDRIRSRPSHVVDPELEELIHHVHRSRRDLFDSTLQQPMTSQPAMRELLARRIAPYSFDWTGSAASTAPASEATNSFADAVATATSTTAAVGGTDNGRVDGASPSPRLPAIEPPSWTRYPPPQQQQQQQHSRSSENERVDASDTVLTDVIQDLDSMRRIAERLAARDDVPEEWWVSMGLGLTRSPLSRSGWRHRGGDPSTSLSRSLDGAVRSGRIERRTPRP